MENKYYTPTIEEFHVGFEYEALWGIENIDGEWLKETFSEKSSISSLEGKIRVKLLDREDIESEGFKFENGMFFKENINELYYLDKYFDFDTKYTISRLHTQDKYVLFEGTIKNKSELQKLLVQLGIK